MTTNRQPPLPATLSSAAAPLLTDLNDDRGPAWLHSGAVHAHAQSLALYHRDHDHASTLRHGLERIAKAHPALEYWGQIAAELDSRTEQRITAFWRENPLPTNAHALVDAYPLGDAWQALSQAAVKTRALCQTPWWAGELLARLSYTRALDEWNTPRVIDPACGTGHLLVEAFRAAHAPRTRQPQLPNPDAALDAVHGIDLDPHAVATTAWRLLNLWRHHHNRCGTEPLLTDAPLHLAVTDALLNDTEPLLSPGRYHAVIANPPYITSRDPDTTASIRQRWPEVCYRRFPLSLPFHARMMDLLAPGGWCAQLTSNAFMKREFGKRYVERFLARLRMEWLIDTSGAYLPGHGTPTVIMVHRNMPSDAGTFHAVLGKRGEPSRPLWPAIGQVGDAIVTEVVRIDDLDRFARRASAHQRSLERAGATGF